MFHIQTNTATAGPRGKFFSAPCADDFRSKPPRSECLILASETGSMRWPAPAAPFQSNQIWCHFTGAMSICASAALRRAVVCISQVFGSHWQKSGLEGIIFILNQGYRIAGKQLRDSLIWGLKALELQMVFVLLSFGSPSVCTHICAWEQKDLHALSKMTEFSIHFKTLKLQMASQGWPLCDTITLLLNLPFLFLHDFHWGKSC